MELDWRPLAEFPEYVISNFGDIVNANSGRWMAQSQNQNGVWKVGLFKNGRQHTRSVGVLVAETFVVGRDEISDTVVHLDGILEHNRADNLAWRPRWFAHAYAAQFGGVHDLSRIGPIRDISTNDRYMDVHEAAIICGLLMEDIRKSIVMGTPCFPTHQRFQMV